MNGSAQSRRDAFASLAALLSGGDSAVREAVVQAADDPAAYLETYEETSERLWDVEDPARDPRLPWLALVDRLLAVLRAVEIDWHSAKADVEWSLAQLIVWPRVPDVTRRAIAALAADASAIETLQEIARLVADDGLRLAAMDIDSDSYVLLLLGTADYEQATAIADKLGFVLRDVREHDPNL
jgi:hypothetical protein